MRLKSQSYNDREWEWENNHGNEREWDAKSYSRTSLIGCSISHLWALVQSWLKTFKYIYYEKTSVNRCAVHL